MPFHIILCHFTTFYVISYHFISFLAASLYPIWWNHEKRYCLIFVRRTKSQLYHWRYSWWINWDISLVKQILKQGGFTSINIMILDVWWCHLMQVKFRHTSRSGWNVSYSILLDKQEPWSYRTCNVLMASSPNFTHIAWNHYKFIVSTHSLGFRLPGLHHWMQWRGAKTANLGPIYRFSHLFLDK